jgi:hypothetical protein
MKAKFIVEQYTGYQYEPIHDAEFDSAHAAIRGMHELEDSMGWRGMRVVKDTGPRYNLSGALLTGDNAHEVVAHGRGYDNEEYDEDDE